MVTGGQAFAYAGYARPFSWYELLDEHQFVCSCGWSGIGSACTTELFREVLEGSCSECDTMLYVRSLPTFDATRTAAAQRSPGA